MATLDIQPCKTIVSIIPFSDKIAERLYETDEIDERLYTEGKPFALLLLLRGGKKEMFFEFGITVLLLNKPFVIPKSREEAAWFTWNGVALDGSDHLRVKVKRCFLSAI